MKISARALRLVSVLSLALAVGAFTSSCRRGGGGGGGTGPQTACHRDLYIAQGGQGVAASNLWRLTPSVDGTSIQDVDIVGDLGVGLTGLAQHPTTHKAYGVTTGQSNNPRSLVEVDLSTGATRLIGELLVSGNSGGSTIAEIEFDANGVLHGWSEDGDLPVTIDVETGEVFEFPDPGISTYGDADGLYAGFWLLSYLQGDDNLFFTDPTNGNTFLVTSVPFPAKAPCGVGQSAMAGGTILTQGPIFMFYSTRIANCGPSPYGSDLVGFNLNNGTTGVIADLPDQSDALAAMCNPDDGDCACDL